MKHSLKEAAGRRLARALGLKRDPDSGAFWIRGGILADGFDIFNHAERALSQRKMKATRKRLVILSVFPVKTSRTGKLARMCRVECQYCGRSLTMKLVRAKKNISCGCFKSSGRDSVTYRHGGSKTREYSIWSQMKGRCHRESSPGFPDYGGRGIFVCSRWRKSFTAFLKDMGPSNGLTIERINNNKGYSKSNCRWATMKDQGYNRRRNPGYKLTQDQIKEIRRLAASGSTQRKLSEDFGVAQCHISRIVTLNRHNREVL